MDATGRDTFWGRGRSQLGIPSLGTLGTLDTLDTLDEGSLPLVINLQAAIFRPHQLALPVWCRPAMEQIANHVVSLPRHLLICFPESQAFSCGLALNSAAGDGAGVIGDLFVCLCWCSTEHRADRADKTQASTPHT